MCGALGAGNGRTGPGHPCSGLCARQHPGTCGRDPAQRLYRDLRRVAHGAHAGRRTSPDHRLRAARRLRRAHRNRAAPPRYRSHRRQPGVPHADGAHAPAARALPAAGTQAAATRQHGTGRRAGHRPAAGAPATQRTAGAFPAPACSPLHPAWRQRRYRGAADEPQRHRRPLGADRGNGEPHLHQAAAAAVDRATATAGGADPGLRRPAPSRRRYGVRLLGSRERQCALTRATG
ncbi:fumarate and nitrate reduction regulatory protein [Xanthomonas axonopodis Xac29-1]|nr:fumarate and nitrate reduction regulatory protein [Xanthomonas axonopodis Xac29-1]